MGAAHGAEYAVFASGARINELADVQRTGSGDGRRRLGAVGIDFFIRRLILAAARDIAIGNRTVGGGRESHDFLALEIAAGTELAIFLARIAFFAGVQLSIPTFASRHHATVGGTAVFIGTVGDIASFEQLGDPIPATRFGQIALNLLARVALAFEFGNVLRHVNATICGGIATEMGRIRLAQRAIGFSVTIVGFVHAKLLGAVAGFDPLLRQTLQADFVENGVKARVGGIVGMQRKGGEG